MIWQGKDCDFNFYVGEYADVDYYYNQFETIEKAVIFYQHLLRLEQEGKEILEEVFEPEEIRVGQIWEGDMHTTTFVSFEMIKNKKTYYERFELGTTKEEFARKMSGYFDKVVEGEITVIEDHSGSGSESEYLLDGVPIWHLIKRGKKMKIEILEEKEDRR